MDERMMARGVGLISLGAGLAMLAMTRRSAAVIGMPAHPQIVRYFGVRDLILGAGLASGRAPHRWVQARMVADTSDAALLATGLIAGTFERRKAALGIGVAAGFGAFGYWLAGRLQ